MSDKVKKYLIKDRKTGETIMEVEMTKEELAWSQETFNNMGYEVEEKDTCKQCGNESKDTYHCKKYHNKKHFG